MSVSLTPLDRDWTWVRGHSAYIQTRISHLLERTLSSWEETPYNEHLRKKGTGPGCGVSCVGFVTSVLDELYSNEMPTDCPEMPTDVGMNNPKGAKAGLRFFLERFPDARRIEGRELQPGDILVVGTAGPGHAMIVGPRPNTLWQASGSRVHYTGWYLPSGTKLFAVYRMADRQVWI